MNALAAIMILGVPVYSDATVGLDTIKISRKGAYNIESRTMYGLDKVNGQPVGSGIQELQLAIIAIENVKLAEALPPDAARVNPTRWQQMQSELLSQ